MQLGLKLSDHMIAFIDESVRTGQGGLLYVVAAATVIQGESDRARDELRKLLLPQQRFIHWHNERPPRRLAMLERLAEVDVMALACSYFPTVAKRQELARKVSLTSLVGDLRGEGIHELVIETRGEALDRQDRRTLLHARDAGLADGTMVYKHAGKLAEPLLWAADAVAGSIALHLAGEDSTYFAKLQASLLKVRQVGP